MIFVVTSTWIDYFNDVNASHTDNLDRLLQSTRIATGDLVISELLRGFRDEKDYRFLRRKGLPIRKTINSIIATFCIANGFELIHNDAAFDPFEEHLGLRVYR